MMLAALLGTAHAGGAQKGNRPPQAPHFSWDTLPVFVHTSNCSGPASDHAIETLARFSLVTIEKFQGACANTNPGPECHQEDAIIDTLKRVRQVNPKATTIFYYNSVINFVQYAFQGKGFPDKQLLRNAKGKLITVNHRGDQSVFDFGQAAAREEWIAECVNATKTGWVDGCFVDRAMDGAPCCKTEDSGLPAPTGCAQTSSPMTPAQCTAYRQGHFDAINNLTAAIAPGPVIGNHAYTTNPHLYPLLNLTGSMTEGIPTTEGGLEMLRWHAERGLAFQAHKSTCPHPGAERTDVLAHFLIGAGELAYFGCGGWDTSGNNASAWDSRWFEEFERPLGAPVADGVKNNKTGTWTRSFKSKAGTTKVSWNEATGGKIDWAK